MATVMDRCTGPASKIMPCVFPFFWNTTPTQTHAPNPPVGRLFTMPLIPMHQTALTFLSRPGPTLMQGPTREQPRFASRPRRMRPELPNCSWRPELTQLSGVLTIPPPLATMHNNNNHSLADSAGKTKEIRPINFHFATCMYVCANIDLIFSHFLFFLLFPFNSYTPLHYCSHYNAHRAARVLLEHEHRASNGRPSILLRMPDFNEKLPIHVAVQRSSSDVLRELLHAGAVVDTRGESDNVVVAPPQRILAAGPPSSPSSPPRLHGAFSGSPSTPATAPSPSEVAVVTPVSSPVLRSMLPARPVQSSKPWNCVTQESINQCRSLIREAEGNWCPERHALFHPNDRKAIVEVLRVGRRLEQMGEGIYVYDIFRSILDYVGRGWFEQANRVLENCCDDDDDDDDEYSGCEAEDRMEEECDSSEADDGDLKPAARTDGGTEGASSAQSRSSSNARPRSSTADDVDFTQFHLE